MAYTRTYAVLYVSGSCYAEICKRIHDADSLKGRVEDGRIDMHGLAISCDIRFDPESGETKKPYSGIVDREAFLELAGDTGRAKEEADRMVDLYRNDPPLFILTFDSNKSNTGLAEEVSKYFEICPPAILNKGVTFTAMPSAFNLPLMKEIWAELAANVDRKFPDILGEPVRGVCLVAEEMMEALLPALQLALSVTRVDRPSESDTAQDLQKIRKEFLHLAAVAARAIIEIDKIAGPAEESAKP